jgi:2-dehydro-3-deoxy-D-arabinonate dehydratase
MRLCRFQTTQGATRIGVSFDGSALLDLSAAGVERLEQILEADNILAALTRLTSQTQTRYSARGLRLLSPVERQEVWAAGVTYLRSRAARMEESQFSATAYDRVYDAPRPELFFKSMPDKVVGPGQTVGIRKDSTWTVPEPELALVLNSKGHLVGYTLGNDMSARDIEGDNLLYLPQAKVYDRSCAVGPFIRVGATEAEVRTWTISLRIQRGTQLLFHGETSIGQIKRRFDELAGWLFRSQSFPHGAILLTGTGIVPPDSLKLQAADIIQVSVQEIGLLENTAALV